MPTSRCGALPDAVDILDALERQEDARVSSGSGSLSRYILVRLLLVIPMMWVVLTMVFFLLRVAPGDPVSAAFGGRLSEEALDVAPRGARASTGR